MHPNIAQCNFAILYESLNVLHIDTSPSPSLWNTASAWMDSPISVPVQCMSTPAVKNSNVWKGIASCVQWALSCFNYRGTNLSQQTKNHSIHISPLAGTCSAIVTWRLMKTTWRWADVWHHVSTIAWADATSFHYWQQLCIDIINNAQMGPIQWWNSNFWHTTRPRECVRDVLPMCIQLWHVQKALLYVKKIHRSGHRGNVSWGSRRWQTLGSSPRGPCPPPRWPSYSCSASGRPGNE